MNQRKNQMTEKQSRYEAVSQMAELLRVTTQKRLILVDPNFENDLKASLYGRSIPDEELLPKEFQVEHYNVLFTEEEHETVKRAFLKLCSEL